MKISIILSIFLQHEITNVTHCDCLSIDDRTRIQCKDPKWTQTDRYAVKILSDYVHFQNIRQDHLDKDKQARHDPRIGWKRSYHRKKYNEQEIPELNRN